MKKLIFSLIILASSFLFSTINAQPKACIWCGYNMNIQPVWGPVGYSNADYYYLPDIEVYYDVYLEQFIYHVRGGWKTSSSLPVRYAAFNLYRAHKVVINEQKPYVLHELNKIEYVSFKGKHDQQAIRDSKDSNYDDAKSRPKHNKSLEVLATSKSPSKDRGNNQHKDADSHKVIATR